MKLNNFRMFLFAFVSILASCSNDDNESLVINSQETLEANRTAPNNPKAATLRIKKVTQITNYSSNDSDTSVTDYIYTGDKLTGLHVVADNGVYDVQYQYNGQKITQANYLEDGQPDGFTTIHYVGNVLSYTLSGTNQDERTEYTYSSGRVQSVKTYYPAGAPGENLYASRTYTYVGGNISQEISEFVPFNSIGRLTYTYDNKKTPLRDMNKYYNLLSLQEGFRGINVNNPITRLEFYPVNNPDPSSQQYYVMEYNSGNYPTTIKRYSEISGLLVSDTTIEYE